MLCLWFYVGVQCVIVVFDVLCVGDLRTILSKKLHLMIGLDKGRICWGCCALLSVHGVVSLLHPLVARFIAFCERLFDILFRNLWGDPEICSIQQEID